MPARTGGGQPRRVGTAADGRPEPATDKGEGFAERAQTFLAKHVPGLDGWQLEVLLESLTGAADGRWQHTQVGLVMPRQNGKSVMAMARTLVGVYLDPNCRLAIVSAHEFGTALEAFRVLLEAVEGAPELLAQVARVTRSHGEEGITLKDGSRVRFRTRTKGGGRGLSADLIVFDEAMILPEMAHAALLPTLSARRDPQIFYLGSAADVAAHDHGVVLARIREAGQRGDARLLYREHCAPVELGAVLADPRMLENRELWRAANPAMAAGRITEEFVELERRSLDPRSFAAERLGVTEWPSTRPTSASVIDAETWAALEDPASTISGRLVFAVDVAPNRLFATIGVAGRRADGKLHIEALERPGPGTGWVVARLVELVAQHGAAAVALDGYGPAASLIQALNDLGVPTTSSTAAEMARACGALFDAVAQDAVRHIGQPQLAGAVAGAATRPLGEAWAWARTKSTIDITPLVAVTLAAWGLGAEVPRGAPMFAFT